MNSESDINRDEPPMPDVACDIRRAGRAWSEGEARDRFALTPEKFEMESGKLFWSDAAVRLGDPNISRAAIRDLG